MTPRDCIIGLALLGLALAGPAAGNTDAKDEETVRAAGVKTDAPALLAFFRDRTLTEADRVSLEERVRQLGSRSFTARERAYEALKKRGVPAIPFLKAALEHKDLEVVRRAERCLAEIEGGPGPELPAAAARLLARRGPPETVPVLLGYAPHADDENVEDAVLETLVALSPTSLRAPAALLDALKDAPPARRAAAGYVLGRRGEETLRAEVRKLLADRDASVRLRAVQGLLVGRDRAAVAALPGLLADAPLGIAWQAEDLLLRLAGERAPAVSLGYGEGGHRARCRKLWDEWVVEHGGKADLAAVQDFRRFLGLTLGIEYNTNRVWECGPDGTTRWEIKNVEGPMEAWVLPGNRVLIADGRGVTERDFKGNVLRTLETGGSMTGCQRLPNGNTFVSTYGEVSEYDREGARIYQHSVGGSNAIRKHRNGNIVYTTQANIMEIDAAGRRVRSVPLPSHNMWVGIDDVDNDRFVVANSTTGRVIEVDATGKILWEANVAGACGVSRLPGGNTLVATAQRVVELDRAGKVVWEKKTDGYVRRVHRR